MSNTNDKSQVKPVILVAEDDPDQSDMLREQLEDEGYAVETAFTGDVAMRWLNDKEYAAAIMDGRMPGQHGGTVLKVCRVQNISTPIIMVSAFATPEDKEKYQRDGAVATFSKPLDVPKLLQVLRTVIVGRETANQATPLKQP